MAFERLYKSGQHEEEIIPVKMASKELSKKINEQKNWFSFFQEPEMKMPKKDPIEVLLEATEETLEEVEEIAHLLPILIIGGFLLLALLGFNIYWLKAFFYKKAKSNDKSDIETSNESTDTEDDCSMIQYENEPSRTNPESLDKIRKVDIDIDNWSLGAESSLCCKDDGIWTHETPENPTEGEDSDDKDTISENSVQIECEIQTFEAKDVVQVEPTEMQSKEKKVKCVHCDKSFQNENGMRTHCLAKHRFDSSNNSIEERQMDSGIESSLENISSVDSSLPSNILYVESETKSFARKSGRRRSGGKNRKGLPLNIPCDLCDGFFATISGLQSHKSIKH